jgi:FMN phosphatase YigB (HAD superfamily)
MNQSFPKDISAIIFDLDGTLYRMKWFMKPLLTIKLFPRSIFLPRYMRVRKLFSGREMQNGHTLMQSMAAELVKTNPATTMDSMVSWVMDDFYRAFIGCMMFFRNSRPGLKDTLLLLKEKGYMLGVISDFAYIEQRLEKLEIPYKIFNTLLSSETAGALKPHPRPFFSLAQNGNKTTERILVIGDREDTDGLAASACGMYFLPVSDKKEIPGHGYSWQTIKKYLDSLSHHIK